MILPTTPILIFEYSNIRSQFSLAFPLRLSIKTDPTLSVKQLWTYLLATEHYHLISSIL